MALARRHVAVQVLLTGAALTGEVTAHAFDFVTLDLRLGLRNGRADEGQEK
jgi:hypothetical protein